MILISFLLFVTQVSSKTDDQALYVRLGNVFESICLSRVERSPLSSRQALPEKTGAKEESGDAGEIMMILNRTQEALDIQARKLANLSNLLSEAHEQIRQLKNDTVSISQRIESRTDYCPMKYNGKCFWIEYRGSSPITYQQGRDICNSQGGKTANIYSDDHFYMMMAYLGTLTRKTAYVHAWIGMTYNSESKTVSLSDGSRSPLAVKWHPGHPNGCCNMGLKAYYADWDNTNQYFWVNPSYSKFEGVICEE